MKTNIIIFLTLLAFSIKAFCQANEAPNRFIFLPPGVHFAPLRANIQEARIGVFKFLDASQMKVDIGNTIDVFRYDIPSSSIKFTAGIDFMAYAFTTGAQGLRLQIDAVDGFFGGNISFSKTYEQQLLQGRIRILHHSAHLVDGHYLNATQQWIDNRQPIPFTQDFGELVFAHVIHPAFGTMRYYGGVSYATLVRPDAIQRFAYLGGIELVFTNLINTIANQQVNVYCAYNMNVNGTPEYSVSHHVQAGVKLGQWFEKGPSLYLAFYSGRHMFGEYYNERLTTLGAGFTVDFF